MEVGGGSLDYLEGQEGVVQIIVSPCCDRPLVRFLSSAAISVTKRQCISKCISLKTMCVCKKRYRIPSHRITFLNTSRVTKRHKGVNSEIKKFHWCFLHLYLTLSFVVALRRWSIYFAIMNWRKMGPSIMQKRRLSISSGGIPKTAHSVPSFYFPMGQRKEWAFEP